MDQREQYLVDRAFNDYATVLNHSAELPEAPEARHNEVNRRLHVCMLAAQIAVGDQPDTTWYEYMKRQLNTQPGSQGRANLEPRDWHECIRRADGSLTVKIRGLSSFSILEALLDRDDKRVTHRPHSH